METSRETILIVDDDPSVRRAVGRLVRSAGWIAVEFSSAGEFLDQHDPEMSGCVILDVSMPGLSGLELQALLNAGGTPRQIIFLTGNGDIPMSVRALKGGAVDFLSKPCGDEALLAAIREALAADARCRAQRREQTGIMERLQRLTPREREVMDGVIAGLMNKQIADQLGAAEKTIKIHRRRVMEKLEVVSVADLVKMAGRAGIA